MTSFTQNNFLRGSLFKHVTLGGTVLSISRPRKAMAQADQPWDCVPQ